MGRESSIPAIRKNAWWPLNGTKAVSYTHLGEVPIFGQRVTRVGLLGGWGKKSWKSRALLGSGESAGSGRMGTQAMVPKSQTDPKFCAIIFPDKS